MYFLIQKKYDQFPSILYSVKDKGKVIHMVLKYMEDNDIANMVSKNDFDPIVLGAGKYLVEQDKNEYYLYEVVNTGIIRNYFEFCKIHRLNIVEYEVRDEVNDSDDQTACMKELMKRYGEK